MTKDRLTIVRIVDDNDEYRNSETFLLRMFGYSVVDYPSALDFLEKDDPAIPGCLILDVKMPEMSGLELQKVMTEKELGLPIIFLTGHGDVEMAVNTLHHESVARAIEADRNNRTKKRIQEEAEEKYNQLTEREKDVCRLVVQGLLNKQIAIELGISEHTVKVHRASIKYKLQGQTPVDLVNLVQQVNAE